MATFKIEGRPCSGTEISSKLDEIIELINTTNDLDAAKAKVIRFNELMGKAIVTPGLGEKSAKAILDALKSDGQDALKHVNNLISIKVEADINAERYLRDVEFYINAGKKAVASSMLRSYTRLVQDFKLSANTAEYERLSKKIS